MEKDTSPAPPRPQKEAQPLPADSAEAAQHHESASELGDRVGSDDEDARDPDASG